MLPLRRHLPSCEVVDSPAPPFQQRPDYSDGLEILAFTRFSLAA